MLIELNSYFTYLKKSTTLLSGRKCTPVLGKRHPYLFLSSKDPSFGIMFVSIIIPSSFMKPSCYNPSCLEETSLFSRFFMILKNSSKDIWPFESKSNSSSKSIASWGSLPRDFIIVYKSFTLTTPVLSLSNMSKMHLKFSISSSEYC